MEAIKAFFYRHGVFLILFVLMSGIYFLPAWQGQAIVQHDMMQNMAMIQEAKEYQKETGEVALWTHNMFGGMPTYFITGIYPKNLFSYVFMAGEALFKDPVYMMLYMLSGFYLLAIILGIQPWIAAVGAIAFGFSTFNLISIEAGHVTKIWAIGMMAPVMAGCMMVFRGQLGLGFFVTAFFTALQIRSSHIQITFYLLCALAMLGIFKLVVAAREKTLPDFIKKAGVLVAAALLAFIPNTSYLWTTYEYSQDTIRGKGAIKSEETFKGLDWDYAMNWSYEKQESFTLLIPTFYGGGSQSDVGKDSETAKRLKSFGVPAKTAEQQAENALTYWGIQRFTSGPVYLGVIVAFLFFLGLWMVPHPIKWWIFAFTLFGLMNAWGKHFNIFTQTLFDYLPLYNKFRSPSMWMVLVELGAALMSVLTLQSLWEKRGQWAILQKPLYATAGALGFFYVLLALAPDLWLDFKADQKESGEKAVDEQVYEMYFNATKNKDLSTAMVEAIRADRKNILQKDAWRALFLLAAAVGILWAFLQQKISQIAIYGGAFAVLITFDLWGVGKRYLNEDNFIDEQAKANYYKKRMTAADAAVLQDKSLHYRVLNLQYNLFNDATPSYFHKNIGGYHAAKIRNYQDLIENYIGVEVNAMQQGFQMTPILNMLNMKYVITGDKAESVVKNPYAMGPAWLVSQVEVQADERKAFDRLATLDIQNVAVMSEDQRSQLSSLLFPGSASGRITLTRHDNHQIDYEVEANEPVFAVFSEIYYNKNKGWKSYLNNTPQPHVRVNHALRGMEIPAGKHTVVFRFEPRAFYVGENISLIGSLIIMLGLVAMIVLNLRSSWQSPHAVQSKKH